MFTLICILAVVYVFLKVSNTRARFAERDAENARKAAEEAAAAKEAAEDEMIRAEALDVDAEVIENDPDNETDGLSEEDR